MSDRLSTIYANVVNLRVTPHELVMEFGSHFPDQPGQGPPTDHIPDVRIVLPVGVLDGLSKVMQQAAAQHQQQQTSGTRKPS